MRYESIIRVDLDNAPERRARDIVDGIAYACALLRDEYGQTADDVEWILQGIIDHVQEQNQVQG